VIVRHVVAALAALALALAGCAATTYDSAGTTAPAGAPDTTVAMSVVGTAAELLPRLDDELAALSERIVDNEGDDEALARVDALWGAARPQVAAERPELLEGFDGVVRLAATAVERRRPADADKASLNLITLVAAYSG